MVHDSLSTIDGLSSESQFSVLKTNLATHPMNCEAETCKKVPGRQGSRLPYTCSYLFLHWQSPSWLKHKDILALKFSDSTPSFDTCGNGDSQEVDCFSQLTKHTKSRTQGSQLQSASVSVPSCFLYCVISHTPTCSASYSVSKGWPNKSCIHLGKSVILGFHQCKFISSFSFLAFVSLVGKATSLWVPLPLHPPAQTSCAGVGECQGIGKMAVLKIQGRPDKGRHVCATLAFLNWALMGSQLVTEVWELSWSCVCIDKHMALTMTVYFKGVSCFANKLLVSFVQKLLCSLSGSAHCCVFSLLLTLCHQRRT